MQSPLQRQPRRMETMMRRSGRRYAAAATLAAELPQPAGAKTPKLNFKFPALL